MPLQTFYRKRKESVLKNLQKSLYAKLAMHYTASHYNEACSSERKYRILLLITSVINLLVTLKLQQTELELFNRIANIVL